MHVMADYILDADLCLPEGAPPLVIGGSHLGWTLTLSNTSSDPVMSVGVLSARLEFEAPSLDEAREISEGYLAQALNAACYVTGHSFAYNSLKQIVDWTSGLTMRDIRLFHEVPMRETADAGLSEEFARSIEHHIFTQTGQRQQTALRWFRLGLQASSTEDQFTYFWFALEIAAESLKDTEKVPSSCPHCRGPLYCKSCDKTPVHRKYAGEAIRGLVDRLRTRDSDDVFPVLQRIRHTLMHGDRIASVIDDLPCTEEQAVNVLCHITREAMRGMFTAKNPSPGETVVIARRADVTRKKIVMTAEASVGMGGDPYHPKYADVPDIKVSMTYVPSIGASDEELD